MENRRPPHPKSSGGYFDRNRSTSFRGAGGGDGQASRSRPRTDGRGDGRDKDRDRSGRGSGQQSRFGGPRKNTGKAFGDHGAFNSKNRGNRDRNHGAKRVGSDIDIKIVSDAQITDGKFRGKALVNSVSPNSTPTCRKLREIAFRIL